MAKLCKANAKKRDADKEKVAERETKGKATYVCAKCHRVSHKEDHLCKPEKVKAANT